MPKVPVHLSIMAETEVINQQNVAIDHGGAQAAVIEDSGLSSEERMEEEKFAILSNKVSHLYLT